MPTHASLLHNLNILQDCTKCDDGTVAVCFLAHFDVMGLICHYLFTPFCGGTGYFMSPEMFINSPSLWIEAVSKFNGTFCVVPNFALDLAAAAEIPPNIDLSSLRFLGNGSESVSIDTMKEFKLKFTPHGLRQCALHAFYGLSEHTVHVCASAAEDLVMKRGQVGHGTPHISVTVKAVDPKLRTEVMEGGEGEIWVHSESKAVGYWGKEELSKELFHAELMGDKEKTYLRTGDVGFIQSGSVFVVGRCSVINGRKIYLNDIENRLESLFRELRPGRTMAMEWDSTLSLSSHTLTQPQAQRRGVAFFAELQNEDFLQAADCNVLVEKMAARIGLDFHVETLLVALLPLKAMPHTGSGKRQRPLCKSNLLTGTLQVIYQWSPSTLLSGNESNTVVQPEFIPLPPTPIPTKKRTSVVKLGDRSKPPPKQLSSVQSPPTATKVPELSIESSPTSEEVAEIPRKESRFRLEDAPMESGRETLAPQTTPRVDHLEAPDTARREMSMGLVGQEKAVVEIISKVLEENIEMDTNIWEHGCDSVSAIQISGHLEQHLGFSVDAHLLYAYQTPRALLEKLKRTLLHLCSPVSAEHGSERMGPLPAASSLMHGLPRQDDDVAIVSMACKFPGCDSPEDLWKLLTEKAVSLSHFQEQVSGKWIHGGFTDRMAIFDHKWFGISAMEASRMDPQQSILLHTAWECLSRAGYASPEEVKGSKIGVFIGFWGSDHRTMSLSSDSHPPCTGYVGSLTANRISYVLDLKGPSMAIDTACAASLTALEVAFSYMHLGKCSQALVGGVNALLDPKITEVMSSMGVLSRSGESRVFDVESTGYVRGEGCGMVMLKRVGEALKDNNRLLAVVKSVETLHNGNSATLTAPNKYTQQCLLRTSLGNAMMDPSDLSYLEAHGTGTSLGDPIEIDAIQEVFGQPDANKLPRTGPLIVGSIKANIGHLEAAAGMAGLIKTVLVLEQAKVPGNPGLETVNPSLKLDPNRVHLPQEMISLDKYYMYGPQSSNLLSAGVNSFGIGGTITNAVLQQFSQLPHLGQVQCSLILGGEFGNATSDQVMGVIQLLRARLTAFNSAYLSCVEAFQRAIKPVKVLTSEAYYQHPAYLMFCLLYSMVQTLQAHDIELSFVMGTTMCAEVVVLAVTEVLILSDAMRLLLAGMAPHVFNIKFIIEEEMQPTTSFLSPTLNHLCLPGRFPPASLNQLIHEIQRTHLMQSTCSDPDLATSLVSIAKERCSTLLAITLHPNSTVMRTVTKTSKTAGLLQLHQPGLMDHIHEMCLQVRRNSDRTAASDCENPRTDVVMPGFYKRYPMRAGQRDSSRRVDDSQYHGRAPTKFRSVKQPQETAEPKQRPSCADESGYITQATSAESLKNSTPAISPIKPQPPMPTELVKSEKPTVALSEQAIINDIMHMIRKELAVDIVQSDREAAEMGLLALGLDSIALIELQDRLLQSCKVDLPLARISELGTVKSIAAEVVKMCEQPKMLRGTDKQDSSDVGRYYTVPSNEELRRFSREKLKHIRSFTVGRSGYGKVEFLGETDISQLDLNRQLVKIEHCAIALCENSKSMLNKRALLYYENVFTQPQVASPVEDPVSELLKSFSGPASLVHSDPEGQMIIKVDRFY